MSFMLQNWGRLYHNLTDAEQALEPAVAALGKRYRVQHPFFGLYLIADFVLLDDKIVIEVDGSSHDTLDQKRKDLKHTIALEARGWAVLRCKNEEALHDPYGTVDLLLKNITSRLGLEGARKALGLLPPEPERKGAKQRRSGPSPGSKIVPYQTRGLARKTK